MVGRLTLAQEAEVRTLHPQPLLFLRLPAQRFMTPQVLYASYLNQYQGGMCIWGILKTTERTLRHLISPLAIIWVATDSAVQRYVHFTLALV